MDKRCDWQGCDSPHVSPAVVKLHEHDDARASDAHTHRYEFELCPGHTAALLLFIQERPLHEAPLDEAR